MCSKTVADPASHSAAPTLRRPWSLAARLAAGFAVASFALLLLTSVLLYWALSNNLDQEDDEYLGEKIAEIERILRDQPSDLSALRAEIERESRQQFYPPVLIRVLNGEGAVLAETQGMTGLLPASAFPKPVAFHGGRWSAETYVTSKASRPLGLVAVTLGGDAQRPSRIVQIALDQTQEQVLLARYRRWIWLALTAGFIVSALVGYEIARRGLRPIRRMAATVRAIGSENLGERVEPTGFPPELSSLAETFNDMLRRLEDSFSRLSQFSADIAHELRTPINNVRGLVEVARGKSHASGADDLLGACLDECNQLSRLIDNLLFLARADRPQTQIQPQRLRLADELETVRAFYEATASEGDVRIDREAPPDLHVEMDRLLLQRALANLVENALAYTPRDGVITLHARQENGTVRIEVSDTGRGIPAEHLSRLFDRFHRVDASRSRNTGGVGLGLAIVKSIATLHGGKVEVKSREGEGATFAVVIPLQIK